MTINLNNFRYFSGSWGVGSLENGVFVISARGDDIYSGPYGFAPIIYAVGTIDSLGGVIDVFFSESCLLERTHATTYGDSDNVVLKSSSYPWLLLLSNTKISKILTHFNAGGALLYDPSRLPQDVDELRDRLSDVSLPLDEIPIGSQAGGWIIGEVDDVNGDRDWYRTTLSAGATVRISVSGGISETLDYGLMEVSPLPDSFFSIRDTAGRPIVGVQGRYGWDSCGDYDGKYAVVEFTAPADGTYYIVVSGGGQDAATQMGHYLLSVAEVTAEPGSTRSTAKAIAPGTPERGFIGFGADPVDIYRFTPTTTGFATAALTDTAPGTDVRTSILDENGNPLGVNIVSAGGTYYVKLDAEAGLPSQTPYTDLWKGRLFEDSARR